MNIPQEWTDLETSVRRHLRLDLSSRMVTHRPMPQSIATVTLVVADYDEAIAFYRDKLGFALIANDDLGGGKRWVLVGPKDGTGARLLLAKADGAEQLAAVGKQTGGRVMLFLETDDFTRDHQAMLAQGIEFTEEPRHESYGSVAVFKDLYGNLWDLIEPRS
jgi:catechol 2,3-dioxygenase-like lactoylglutathione lyase family enzyme